MLDVSVHLTLPDQLSVGLGAEGHDLPIRNRHFDDEVQILVLLVLRLRPVLWFIGDNPLPVLPGVTAGDFSLQEVDSGLRLRKKLQLKVSNAEVPSGVGDEIF